MVSPSKRSNQLWKDHFTIGKKNVPFFPVFSHVSSDFSAKRKEINGFLNAK